MAANIVGHLPTFDDTLEDWPTYIERVELYFLANSVSPDKKVASFLTCLGAKTYSLVRSLVAPEKPSDKTFEDLKSVLELHFCPKPLTIAERFRFYRREQKPSESASEFLAELRRLARSCEFGTFLEEALRDRFVCGLQQEAILKRLLAEPQLTLTRALELAVAAETASRDAQELQQHQSTVQEPSVHKLQGFSGKAGIKSPRSGFCYRCGSADHYANSCRHVETICDKCGKKGHLQKVCRSDRRGPRNQKQMVHNIQEKSYQSTEVHELADLPGPSNELVAYVNIHNVDSHIPAPITVQVKIDKIPLAMELDTGSAVSVIPFDCYQAVLSGLPLHPTSLILKTYSGELLHPKGVLRASVMYEGQCSEAELYVVKAGKFPLFGRDLLAKFKLKLDSVNNVGAHPACQISQNPCDVPNVIPDTAQKLRDLLVEYKHIFSEELGTLKGIKAKLHLKPEAVPKFLKARPVPYALRTKVEEELNRLEQEGVISKVQWSNWASPIVAVPKPDGTVRLCGDFKATVNPCLNVDQYPLPGMDDIFSGLAGGQFFSKVDLRNAYLQIEMEEESKELLTINTHKGLYRYNRLPFGIASAPAIWQRSIDQVLQDLKGVQGLLDDTLVTGSRDPEHLSNLRALFSRISDHGLRLKGEKCEFFRTSLEFCGHRVDRNGLHKTDEKIKAILDAPRPRSVHELRSFLGLVNYYCKFLCNAAQFLYPLHKLLEKNAPWVWSDACEQAYCEAKQQLSSPRLLVHYNQDLPVRLTCDAGPQGIGAVLSHVMGKGEDRPIAFASRSLTSTEQKYSQIDREALALVWGIKKFYKYLFGRHFLLATDHKPLLSIFHPEKGIPAMTASRLQRYAMFLSGLNFTIEHVPSQKNGHADALSRLPLPITDSGSDLDATDLFHLSILDVLPVTASEVRRETARDPVLSQVLLFSREGWNGDSCPSEVLHPFFSKRHELSISCDVLMWGSRVCIPPSLRGRLLQELHATHMGIMKMKGLARGFMWWPSMDRDIEDIGRGCPTCSASRNMPESSQVHPWEFPSAPWRRIHVDFAGPVRQQMFLIVVDAHSKWPEVKLMSTTTTTATIQALREMFSRNGLPEQLVSDNGPQFSSEDFRNFMQQNGIRHIRTAPYHPSTNGLAERFVQTLKGALGCLEGDGNALDKTLANVLLSYRTTPHATTGQAPATLFFGRQIRTRLSLLTPNLREVVQGDQMQRFFQKPGRSQQFSIGARVLARDYRPGHKWTPGRIVACSGTRSYEVQVEQNKLWKRHLDQLLPDHSSGCPTRLNPQGPVISPGQVFSAPTPPVVHHPTATVISPGRVSSAPVPPMVLQPTAPELPPDQVSSGNSQTPSVPAGGSFHHRYPVRVRKPPERYGL